MVTTTFKAHPWSSGSTLSNTTSMMASHMWCSHTSLNWAYSWYNFTAFPAKSIMLNPSVKSCTMSVTVPATVSTSALQFLGMEISWA